MARRRPYHLIIDTSVWLNMIEAPGLHNSLNALVADGHVILLLPDLVIEEWGRNKERAKQDFLGKLEGLAKSAHQLAPYIRETDKTPFRDTLQRFHIDLQHKRIEVEHLFHAVEELFVHPTTIRIQIGEAARLKSVEYGLLKKAPFGNDNGMADACILFSALDYCKQRALGRVVFVTANIKDFSDLKRKDTIHPDLADDLSAAHGAYSINLSNTLNKIKEGIVDSETQEREAQAIYTDFLDRFSGENVLSRLFAEMPSADYLKSSLAFDNMTQSFQDAYKQNQSLMDRLQSIVEADQKISTIFQDAASHYSNAIALAKVAIVEQGLQDALKPVMQAAQKAKDTFGQLPTTHEKEE